MPRAFGIEGIEEVKRQTITVETDSCRILKERLQKQ